MPWGEKRRECRGVARLALGFLLASASCASFHSSQAKTQRWLLVYEGSTSLTRYNEGDFARLLGKGSACSEPLFSGVIFLSLQWRHSGRWFATWLAPGARGPNAQGADWQAYLDSLVAEHGALQRLQRALDAEYPTTKLDVAVMVPYLGASSPSLTMHGKTYSVTSSRSANTLYEDWFRTLRERVDRLGLRSVRLLGGYWLNEGLLPGDSATIVAAAEAASRAKFQLLWIPAFGARGAAKWRELGFARAWYQPNYFFDQKVAQSRLDSAARFAAEHALGIELEFDRRLVRDSDFADRLDPYLALIERHRFASIVVYDGAGAFLELLDSRNGKNRRTVRRLLTDLCPVAAR